MAKIILAPLAAVLLVLLASAHAQEYIDEEEDVIVSPRFLPRNLQAGTPPPRATFPFITCNRGGAGSPYLLDGTPPVVVMTPDQGDLLNVTLTIIPNPAAGNTTQCSLCPSCVGNITNNLHSLSIRSGIQCTNSEVYKAVYVDGKLKTNGVFWSLVPGQNDAVLHINNIQLGQNTIGSVISIVVGAPCNTPAMLTGPRGGKLFYAMSDFANAGCCPVNSWDWGASSGGGSSPGDHDGSLTVDVALDASKFDVSDVTLLPGSPLPAKVLETAINASISTAGLLNDVLALAVTPDVAPTVGATSTYLFNDATMASLAGSSLVKGLHQFITAASIPCGSVITVASGTGPIGSYACTATLPSQMSLKALCKTGAGQVCTTPHKNASPPPDGEHSAEGSAEGSTEISYA